MGTTVKRIISLNSCFHCFGFYPNSRNHCIQLDTANRWFAVCGFSGTEPLTVFAGGDERFNHFGVDEVAVELIQLIQPEVVALIVEGLFGRIVRVSSEVTKVLHQHECPVLF